MGKINAGRVVAGGLAAGVVIGLGEWLASIIFKAQYEAMFEAVGVTEPSMGAMVALTLGGFLVGMVMVWLYAAMRPRVGAGPGNAFYAGLAVWFLAWLWPTASGAAMGIYTMTAMGWVIVVVWSLIEVEIAAMVGGWLYREDGESPAAP